MRHEPRVEPTHESLFLQRYERLVAWAAGLCGHDREQAEDLVHDAFLAFTQARPDLSDIDNLDGYLRGMLKKLRVSAVRQATRGGPTSLSMIDHDSAALGLRAVGAATVEAKHELDCVCRYACARKSSSKAGSILILRFFHGYFPSEIARIARCDARVVDELLRIARREAKLFRDAPSRLKFFTETRNIPPLSLADTAAPDDPDEFLRALQDAIFKAVVGTCPTPETLEAFYAAPASASASTRSMDAAGLAHLVSCRACLDLINSILRLTSSDHRSPHDMLGPGSRGGTRRIGRAGRPSEEASRRRERRWRTSYEHRASKLRILVNGFLVGSHSVGSALTRQTVAVTLNEPVGSVEVVSERGVRLAFLDVEPQPRGHVEQTVVVALSEDRMLRVGISFASPWPEVDVEYEDPHWREHDLSECADEEASLPTEAFSGTFSHPPIETVAERAQTDGWALTRGIRSWWSTTTARRRWTLALAAGCLAIAMALVSSDTAVWAAERISQAVAAIAHEIVSLSRGSRQPRPLISRPLSFIAPPLVAPARVYDARTLLIAETTHATPSAAILARAEIEALARLDAVGELLGGQIDVRKAGSRVIVSGLVADEERKRRLVDALTPLRRMGLARLDVATIAERLRADAEHEHDDATPTPEPVLRYQPLSFDSSTIAAADLLREALLRQPEWRTASATTISREIRRIATEASTAALNARLHGALLRAVADRYRDADLRALSPDAYDAWRALLATHASVVHAELQKLRELLPLQPVGVLDAAADDVAEDGEAVSQNEQAEQLARATVAIDEAMRAALSLSMSSEPRSSGSPSLNDPHLWNVMARAERLAHALQQH